MPRVRDQKNRAAVEAARPALSEVDTAIDDSFPASDPPAYSTPLARDADIAAQQAQWAGTATPYDIEAIRLRAYELWLSEGRPEGRAKDHWAAAERDIRERPARTETPGIATAPIEAVAAFGRRS